MLALFLPLFLFLSFTSNEGLDDARILVSRAAKKDSSIFASPYLFEQFAAWQTRFQIQTFKIDSVASGPVYNQIWLSKPSLKQNATHSIALLVTKAATPRIVDIKRTLLSEHPSFKPLEQEALGFIEKLVWIFETGGNGFLFDFFYPAYIKIEYQGVVDKKNAIERLRRSFNKTLPLKSIAWKNVDATFVVDLILDAGSSPLQLRVDMQKYLTSRFFEVQDKHQKAQTLKDSIQVWLTSEQFQGSQESTLVKAVSARQAVENLLDEQLQDYNLMIWSETDSSITLEANLPSVHQVTPISLNYSVVAKLAGSRKYMIQANWLPLENLDRFFAAAQNGTGARKINEPQTFAAINRTLHRYGSLGLPSVFQPAPEKTSLVSGSLAVHSTQVDSVRWQGGRNYASLLRGITRGKVSTFFLKEITADASNAGAINVSGYAIWQDRRYLWQHLAKIHETYREEKDVYQLSGVMIDLFPFIRNENVQALFAASERRSSGKRKIKIHR